MIIRPYLIARWGVYGGLVLAGLSAFWAYNAGNSIDGALMRSVFVFVIFVALAFGAEAVLISGPIATQAPAAPAATNRKPESSPETEDE